MRRYPNIWTDKPQHLIFLLLPAINFLLGDLPDRGLRPGDRSHEFHLFHLGRFWAAAPARFWERLFCHPPDHLDADPHAQRDVRAVDGFGDVSRHRVSPHLSGDSRGDQQMGPDPLIRNAFAASPSCSHLPRAFWKNQPTSNVLDSPGGIVRRGIFPGSKA
jgi:hypothetical protein